MGWIRDFFGHDRGQNGKSGNFCLYFRDDANGTRVKVGHLSHDGSTWEFRYDEEFKQRPDIRPLEGFKGLDAVYRSPVLFPIFQVRIPDTQRPDVRRLLEQKKLQEPRKVDLLRVFGRRTLAAPNLELEEEPVAV